MHTGKWRRAAGLTFLPSRPEGQENRRGRALQTALTEAIAGPLTRTKAVRQGGVLQRRPHHTLAEIAEMHDLPTGRVNQLAKGK
ncbi:hypothetical protein [Streptomyces sp. NPDC005303]|uniref:hypothetical protein n=1 Tax=Streptomyces sp. NPDC005303 TaxID=3155713 RepID=UPI0033AEEE5A